MSTPNDSLILPTKIESQIIFEEDLIKIQRDQLQLPEQPPYTYYSLMTRPFSVAILAMTPEGAYLLNEEYRHPTGKVILGCPGGFIDPGEEILEAAKRELLEETGYQAQDFHVLGSAFPYAGITGQKTIFIRAFEAILTSPSKLEQSEIIRPRLLMPNEIIQWIKEGKEVDGILCAALFFQSIIEPHL